ncbi:MAG: hypothetical protein JWN04_6631 [Myxococcaceae bacterium]|nr:hypothetical protein [Myxococcaceae bacterium]
MRATPMSVVESPRAQPVDRFEDSLETKLSLVSEKDSFDYAAGAIECFQVELRPWGFEASALLRVSAEQEDDPLLAPFTQSTAMTATLSFARDIAGEDDAARPTVSGPVVARTVSEIMGGGIVGAPPVMRRYEIRFCDPAAALWKAHWPVELYARASMASVIKAQKAPGIELELEWSELELERPVLCLPLAEERGVSFYDFLLGWVARHGGVFEYDCSANKYRIASKKRTSKLSTSLQQEIARSVKLHYPLALPFTTRIRNALAVDAKTTALEQPAATQGIYRDVLIREPVVNQARARADLESLRHRYCPLELEVSFSRCPEVLALPGSTLTVGEDFSDKALTFGKTFRVLSVSVEARQTKPDDNEPEDGTVVYETALRYTAELATSTLPRLPPHASADPSVIVEGMVVSAGGADTERTWSATENTTDALWTYKVHVALFNREVPCPFAPLYSSGHFFFPAYKHQRVCVALHWDRAEIVGFLDWSEEGRLPIDSQGNQIVMGPKLGNGTVIRHSYVDSKPVLRVERKTPEETQVISIADGLIRISLEEEKIPPTTVPLFDVTPQLAAAKDQVTSKVQAGLGSVTSQYQESMGALSNTIDEASAQVDAQLATVKQGVLGRLDEGEARLRTAGDELKAIVEDVRAQTSSTLGEIRAAMPDMSEARARVLAVRTRAKDKLTRAGSPPEVVAAALRPVDQTLSKIDAVEQEAKTMVEGAVRALQGAQDTLSATLESAQAQVQALLDGATEAFAGVRRSVRAIDEVVKMPLRVLDELVPKLQTPFKLATGALSEVTTRVESVLGAIKATGLPKALVQPATSAIQAATHAILPPLDPLISQAVTQLRTLASTLGQQVTTAQKAAQEALTAQQTQLEAMIKSVTEPLQSQLTMARTAAETELRSHTEFTKRMTAETTTAVLSFHRSVDALVASVENLPELKYP